MEFPEEEWPKIERMRKASGTIVTLLSSLALSILIFHSGVPTPIIEWATALFYVNFFAIASSVNDFYDSVHPYGKLVPKTQ